MPIRLQQVPNNHLGSILSIFSDVVYSRVQRLFPDVSICSQSNRNHVLQRVPKLITDMLCHLKDLGIRDFTAPRKEFMPLWQSGRIDLHTY